MTTLDALLRTVLERPGDDDARLVLADALDDTGQEERGEFIRVQADLFNLPAGSYLSGEALCFHDDPAEYCWRCRRLRQRQEKLFSTDWLPLLDGELREWVFNYWPEDYSQDHRFAYLLRRGFVDEVRCALADWVAHGKTIVGAQPVTRVTLSDRVPAQSLSGWWWASPRSLGGQPQSVLHESLFAGLPGVRPGYSVLSPSYPSPDAALSALSSACVAWARQEAGLPPPPEET